MEEYILKKWRKYAERNYERETRYFAAFLLSECSTGLRSDDDVSRDKEMLLNRVSLLERDSSEMRNIIEELKRKLEANESMSNDDYTEMEGLTEKKRRKYSERSNEREYTYSGASSPTRMYSERSNEREYTSSPIRMHSERSYESENTYSPIRMHSERSNEREYTYSGLFSPTRMYSKRRNEREYTYSGAFSPIQMHSGKRNEGEYTYSGAFSPIRMHNRVIGVEMGSSSNEEYDIINEEMRRQETHLNLVSLLKRDSAEMGNRIEVLQRKLQVMEYMEGDDNKGIQLKHDQMCKEFQEKNEELLDLNYEFIAKEQLSHNELLKVRKELIKGFSSGIWDNRTHAFGIKRMGEIDANTFVKTCMLKFPSEKAVLNAVDLCSLWQVKLQNSGWYPFKVIEDGKGNFQKVVDDDQSLMELKNEWGEDIYNAVVTAFKELNEYNPSERYPVLELWNFKENTKASPEEVISYIFKQMKSLKRKKPPTDQQNQKRKTSTGALM